MTLPKSELSLNFGGRFQKLLLPLLAILLLNVYIRTLKVAAAKYHPWWEAELHAIHGQHGPTQFGLSRPINQGRRAVPTGVSSAHFRRRAPPRTVGLRFIAVKG
jgi:hypothetical protein